jgi:hypothetical protein
MNSPATSRVGNGGCPGPTRHTELKCLARKSRWRPRIWLNWRWLNATKPARGSRHVRRYTESAEQRHHD